MARPRQDHGLDKALDNQLIELCEARWTTASRSRSTCRSATSTARSARCSAREVTRRYGGAGLPDGTDRPHRSRARPGSRSARSCPRGITLRLEGDANDYVGKGLSGGRIVVRPDRGGAVRGRGERHRRQRDPATAPPRGEVFLRGVVGERFCVRNSGATAVVEGVGDHALRVHDRRPRGDPRHRPGATSRRACPAASRTCSTCDPARVNREHGRPRAGSTPEDAAAAAATSSSGTREETGSAVAGGCWPTGRARCPRFAKVMPQRLQAGAGAGQRGPSGGPRRNEAVMAAAHG